MNENYADLKLLHSGDNSEVSRAIRSADNQSVVLKRLKASYPTADQIRRYRQEYQLIGSPILDLKTGEKKAKGQPKEVWFPRHLVA